MAQLKHYTVYSTPTCGYCKLLKQWLDENHIAYEAVDVALDPARGQEMVEKTGQLGVPVSIITFDDGAEEIILGFDKFRIGALLGIS